MKLKDYSFKAKGNVIRKAAKRAGVPVQRIKVIETNPADSKGLPWRRHDHETLLRRPRPHR